MKLFETEDHPDIATTLSNMASVYHDLGQVQKALDINERVYGRELVRIVRTIVIIFFLSFIYQSVIVKN